MLEHLYDALNSPLGIELETEDLTALRLQLYKVRKAANDPNLACLSFLESPLSPNKLWIVKRPPDAKEE